jgi:hypothetical protein
MLYGTERPIFIGQYSTTGRDKTITSLKYAVWV